MIKPGVVKAVIIGLGVLVWFVYVIRLYLWNKKRDREGER